MTTTESSQADFGASLPRKQMAAGALLFDAAGRILLVQPTYKQVWDLPGGVVEADESPHTAVCRELKEELGLHRAWLDLLTVDWQSPQDGMLEGMRFVFDGGVVQPDEISAITLPADELRGWAFCTPEEAKGLVSPRLARRISASLDARSAGRAAYLENGYPLDRPWHDE
ncbi:NUDIX hydrolase [Actinopolymorpha pittospori]|uniref:ADP-ribose pyrophosphatase YjhB (NUDIX family) n=1 Tax=Actinopolymorpha pittospori TaxID=648752 RepID=A0A927R8W1_9ACTN|nr:ADP-ribose pyrophosphatase YjhB (NUDIX family) [Actinopolymorpha pittospori]